MKELMYCPRCQHSTMQVSVSDTGEVEVLCATCKIKVLGFFSDDEFTDVLHDMDVLKEKKINEMRGLN